MTRKLIYHRPDLCATPSCRAKQPNHYFHCDDCRQGIRATAGKIADEWMGKQRLLDGYFGVAVDTLAANGVRLESDGNPHP